MTYNVFGGTLSLTQSVNQSLVLVSSVWHIIFLGLKNHLNWFSDCGVK